MRAALLVILYTIVVSCIVLCSGCAKQYYLVSLENREAYVAKKVKPHGKCVTLQDHKGKWYILCGKYKIEKLHRGR